MTASTRGEASFVNLPGFGARLYASLTRSRGIEIQFQEIARYLISKISHGSLLDVGTGPGRLLQEVHQLNPGIELYGLDIAGSMVRLARKRLTGTGADLRQGNIRSTDYDSDFFDLVTCTGSLYLWDQPEAGLEEIARILKAGKSAYLFETHRDFSWNQFREAIEINLQQESQVRRLITLLLLKKQIGMTCTTGEFAALIERTSFAGSYAIDNITLAGLPIWCRIKLTKGPTA